MAKSKDVYESILDDFENFKNTGEEWCELEDITAAGQARNYAKRIIKNMRTFVQATIEEAALVKPEPVEVIEVVEEKEEYNNPYPEAY